jgi:hypothetical protein
MRSREFIAGLGSAAAWPLAVHAQQAAVPVIGYLSAQSADGEYKYRTIPFLRGLKEAGYVESQNVAIEYRYAENQFDRLSALAADLVRRRVARSAALFFERSGRPQAASQSQARLQSPPSAQGCDQARDRKMIATVLKAASRSPRQSYSRAPAVLHPSHVRPSSQRVGLLTEHSPNTNCGNPPSAAPRDLEAMTKPELGTKRLCARCGAKFYDLHNSPITCPQMRHGLRPRTGEFAVARRSRTRAGA